MARGRRLAFVAALALLVACSSGGGAANDDNPLAPPLRSGTQPPLRSGTPPAAAPGSGYGSPVLLGNVQDREVTESSGLVASRRNPGLYWTHNDSDDGPFVYCVGGHGEPCGTWRVNGADAFDWEDIAAGPGPDPSMPYLYVGDIGDNLDDRSQVVVYRVPEPVVTLNPGSAGPTKASPGLTDPSEALRLRYPDGSHNAEALLVHPQSGDLYIVVKDANPRVYVARAPLSPSAINMMRPVATLPIGDDGGVSLVTGGDIAPDGRRLALCTYGPGYELRLPAGAPNFDDIWQQPPQTLALGARVQGEAIAYRLDGKALLTTSESPQGLADPLQQIEAA